jgi:hypothetical protein
MNDSPTATLRNVIDGIFPQDMKPELEEPIAAERFKPAMEKGALKRWPEEDGIFRICFKLLRHNQNDILLTYNQRMTNRSFATKQRRKTYCVLQ